MSRAIDKDEAQRTVPMRVIHVGMCRTSSLSLYKALQILGFNPYHMVVLLKHGKRDIDFLREAIEAHYAGKGERFGRKEFDKWFGPYDAVTDIPSSFFVEEIYQAYPDAKFILTDRSVESWMKSMNGTVFNVCDAVKSGALPWIAMLDYKFTRSFVKFARSMGRDVWKDDYRNSADEYYRNHIELVKRTIPPEQLLTLRLEDGIDWKPICEFLDVPIPKEPYPRGNEPEAFKVIVESNVQRGLKNALMESLVYTTPIICLAAWYFLF